MAIFAPWTAVQKTLPYNYGFENNDLAGEGWSIVNGATGYYTTGINAEAAQTGDYGFMFFYSTNPPQYLITPELNGTDNGVEVTFYYKNCSTYEETFTVGYSTTTSETTALHETSLNQFLKNTFLNLEGLNHIYSSFYHIPLLTSL